MIAHLEEQLGAEMLALARREGQKPKLPDWRGQAQQELPDRIADRRALLLSYLKKGMSAPKIAEATGINIHTVTEDRKQLIKAGVWSPKRKASARR